MLSHTYWYIWSHIVHIIPSMIVIRNIMIVIHAIKSRHSRYFVLQDSSGVSFYHSSAAKPKGAATSTAQVQTSDIMFQSHPPHMKPKPFPLPLPFPFLSVWMILLGERLANEAQKSEGLEPHISLLYAITLCPSPTSPIPPDLMTTAIFT